jgi:hypothetical protein
MDLEKSIKKAEKTLTAAKKAVNEAKEVYQRLDNLRAEYKKLLADLEYLSPTVAKPSSHANAVVQETDGNPTQTPGQATQSDQSEVLTAFLTANGLSCLPTPVQPAPAPTPQPQERVKFVPVKTVAVQTPTDSKSSTKKNGAAQIDEILGKSQPSNTSFEVPDVPPVP